MSKYLILERRHIVWINVFPLFGYIFLKIVLEFFHEEFMELLMFEFYAKHVIQEEEEQKEEEEYNSDINIDIYFYQICSV